MVIECKIKAKFQFSLCWVLYPSFGTYMYSIIRMQDKTVITKLKVLPNFGFTAFSNIKHFADLFKNT